VSAGPNVHAACLAWRRVDFTLTDAPDAAAVAQLGRESGAPWNAAEVARRLALARAWGAIDAHGRTVGFATLIEYGDDLAWLGSVFVHPDARGHDIAGALTDAALDAAGNRTVGLDASNAGKPLYDKRGFRAVATGHEWTRDPTTPRPPPGPSAECALYPVSSCEIMELFDYDRPRWGVGRAPLLADCIGRAPLQSFVAVDRQTRAFAGFVMGASDGIGPLCADSAEAAAWLLHAAERAGAYPSGGALDGEPIIDVLRAAGYQPSKWQITRMVRGGDLPMREGLWRMVDTFAFG